MKNEGYKAFYKGLGTKLVTIGPKIIFTYATSQYFITTIQDKWKK